ncbi:MAG: acyloxyacyl hydrolase [Breznakibacter sp.]
MGVAINYGVHDFSEKAIDTYGCNIRFGGTFQYWHFNHRVLGSGLAGLVYTEPFLYTRDRFMSSIRASAGLIGLTKPYSEAANPSNLAYSTHVAFPLSIELNFYFPLADHWALAFSAGFNHFSNGGIKKPNYGLNYSSLALGIEYNFTHYGVPPRLYSQNLRLAPQHKRPQCEVAVSFALSGDDNGNNKNLYVLTNAKYYRQLTRINGIGTGVLLEHRLSGGNPDGSPGSLSLLLGHRFYLGKFSFTQDMALSLLGGLNSGHPFFQLYAIDFALTDNLLLGTILKAHGNIADYPGIRLGVRW